ncbi:MAG: CRISPR-associated protein Csx15 [Patescibacteria group bacterium]
MNIINFSDKNVSNSTDAKITFDFQQPIGEQVLNHFTRTKDVAEVVLPANGVCAITMMAALRVNGQFPAQSLLHPGQGWDRCDNQLLETVRHEAREKYRNHFPEKSAQTDKHFIVNFGHPLTDQQINDIATAIGVDRGQINTVDINAGQLPLNADGLRDAIFGLIEQAGITKDVAESGRVVVCPPPMGQAAACLGAAWHGAYGSLPKLALIGMKPEAGFQFLQLVNPEEVYLEARKAVAQQTVSMPFDLFKEVMDVVAGANATQTLEKLEALRR